MTEVYEVPREEWPDFTARFSHDHRGQVVTIEVKEPGQARAALAHDRPLQGLTVDLDEDGTDSLSVIVGDSPDKELTHTVTGVQHVRLREGATGRPGVEIETAGGGVTEVRLGGASDEQGSTD